MTSPNPGHFPSGRSKVMDTLYALLQERTSAAKTPVQAKRPVRNRGAGDMPDSNETAGRQGGDETGGGRATSRRSVLGKTVMLAGAALAASAAAPALARRTTVDARPVSADHDESYALTHVT